MLILNRNCARVAILSLLFFSACGYGFTGGRELPEGAKTVFIKIFENTTSEIGVENFVTNDLINEFTQHHRELLVNDIRNADSILTGRIFSIRTSTDGAAGGRSNHVAS